MYFIFTTFFVVDSINNCRIFFLFKGVRFDFIFWGVFFCYFTKKENTKQHCIYTTGVLVHSVFTLIIIIHQVAQMNLIGKNLIVA